MSNLLISESTVFHTNNQFTSGSDSIIWQFSNHLRGLENPTVTEILDVLIEYTNLILALEPNDSRMIQEICGEALDEMTRYFKNAQCKGDGELVVSQSPNASLHWVQVDCYTWTYKTTFFDRMASSDWKTINNPRHLARIAFQMAASIKGVEVPLPLKN